MPVRIRLLFDLLALAIIVGYVLLARSTTTGGAADPVWQAVQARGELIVGTDAGYRPFADLQDGKFIGYDIELMEEIGRRLGLRVRFVNVGYDALFGSLAVGRVDVLAAGLPLTPEQSWTARFTAPYFDAGLMLMVPPGSPIAAAGDLSGKRVAVALGSTAHIEARRLQRRLPSLQIVDAALSPAAALQLLRAGSADAAIVDAPAAIAALNTSADLQIAAALTYEPYVLAVPVHAYKLHEELNRILEDLRREGFFTRLNERWLR